MKTHRRIRTRLLSIIMFMLLFGTSLLAVMSVVPKEAEANPDLAFLSTPTTEAYAYYKYDYEVIPSNYSANLTLYWTDATWDQLLIANWHLVGFPDEGDYGRVWMSLRLELMGTEYAWQNFTIDVVALDVMLASNYNVFIPLTLALVFSFGLLLVGFRYKEFWIMAGPVWIISGVQVFRPYDDFFMLASIGIGMVLMMWGVYSVLD